MLTPQQFGVPPHSPLESPLLEGSMRDFNWDARLSLELIRQHTKTDDAPGVTDQQLRLYRASSIEAAEHYTGFLLQGQKNITEPIQREPFKKWGRLSYNYKLKYPSADGIVYIYGDRHGANVTLQVEPGTRTIQVPIRTGYLDLSNCCDPCAKHYLNAGLRAAYRAGFKCIEDVPAGVIVGCLQYITWIIEHPGDELLTSRNRLEARAGAVTGSNNIALVSGALETWRQYDPEAI